jgi:hypothetical protein
LKGYGPERELEMSKKVKYPNGFIGVASDKVAGILEKRGSAKIVGDAKAATTAPKADEEKIANLKERLAHEKAQEHPNGNAIRGLEMAIEKAEK